MLKLLFERCKLLVPLYLIKLIFKDLLVKRVGNYEVCKGLNLKLDASCLLLYISKILLSGLKLFLGLLDFRVNKDLLPFLPLCLSLLDLPLLKESFLLCLFPEVPSERVQY